MRKRIEKGLSIKPKKSNHGNQEIYMGLEQYRKFDKTYKEGYEKYIQELKKGHPMAR